MAVLFLAPLLNVQLERRDDLSDLLLNSAELCTKAHTGDTILHFDFCTRSSVATGAI